ncbi:hypothetical protein PUMCH_000252 [Australozyma saopauloensis]|uniref:Zn(2)-C6 fungal-type domain-containing protein n=1 Tax=Australozyma saopauloensis TaxID=291208 RepID=A0AAX4H3P2_9ASCO|nr:hypothetical protein PUMCH_000252 [[Candida] saopauloensis]
MEHSFKRRHRIPASCLVCRKRKSKCDRVRPICSSCRKKLIAHLCTYEDTNPYPIPEPGPSFIPVGQMPPHGQGGMAYVALNPHMMPVNASPFQVGVPNKAINPMQQPYNLSSPWPTSQNPFFALVPNIQPQSSQQTSQPFPQQMPLQAQAPTQAKLEIQLASLEIPASNPDDLKNHAGVNNSAVSVGGPDPQLTEPPTYYLQANNRSVHSGSYSRNSDVSEALNQLSRMSLSLQQSAHSDPRRQSSTFLYSNISNALNMELPLIDQTNLKIPSLSVSNALVSSQNTPAGVSSGINYESLVQKEKDEAIAPPHPYRPESSLPTPETMSVKNESHIQKLDRAKSSSLDSLNVQSPARNLKESIIKFKVDKSTPILGKKRKSADSESPGKVQLPEKAEKSYVSVAIGTRLLNIDSEDSLTFFEDASYALMVEGHFWQQQGPLSYVGLTKTDPFIKLVRNFTTDLFKSEQFSKYVSRKKQKKHLNSSASSSSSINHTDTSMSDHRGNNLEGIKEESTAQSSAEEDEEEGDVFEEDALIVTKIRPDSSKEDSSEQFGVAPKPILLLPGIPSLHSLHSIKGVYFSFVEDNILLVLPRKTAMSTAIYMYFRYVHPFIPILHEQTFLQDIRPLFRSSEEGKLYHSSISIKSENQQNLAGMLLLVIRLGYMTLIPNTDTEAKYTKKEQELIKDITRFKSDHYMGVVDLCIPEEKVKTKSTFKYVQCLALLFFYRSVAPNDCLGLSGSDSQLLFGALVNHALSIGLNRDPKNYIGIRSICKNKHSVEMWRNLWSYIVQTDAEISIYCGTALKIPDIRLSDVKSPTFEKEMTEETEYFEKIQDVHACYRRIVSQITNLASKPKVVDILSETSYLETKFLEIFGENFFRDFVCRPAGKEDKMNGLDSLKVDKFIRFISIRVNLSCFYFLIVLHYEQKVDNNVETDMGAGTELFKIFIKSAVQVVYIMTYALDNSQELFGRYFDWLLTSRIEHSMIKTHSFATSVFIRIVNMKRTLTCQALQQLQSESSTEGKDPKFSQARMDVVDSLFGISITEAELFVGNFRALSKTHINSYKLYVMAYFALKQCMENPEHILKGFTGQSRLFFHNGTNLLLSLSLTELESMSELCEEFRIAKIDSLRRKRSHVKAEETQQKGLTEHSANTNLFAGKQSELAEAPTLQTNIGDTPLSMATNETDNMNSFLEDDLDSMAEEFDALLANRTMYANDNTVNTYGLLQPRHMDAKFQKEVFDSQSMIGNDELFQLFEMFGDLD